MQELINIPTDIRSARMRVNKHSMYWSVGNTTSHYQLHYHHHHQQQQLREDIVAHACNN